MRAERIGTTSVTFDHAAYRVGDDGEADELMVTAKQTLVCLDLAARKAIPVPDEYRRLVLDFEGGT